MLPSFLISLIVPCKLTQYLPFYFYFLFFVIFNLFMVTPGRGVVIQTIVMVEVPEKSL